ncbi:MAG: 5'-deoxynucleotidase [Oscillospiraceae bacterium]
MEYGFCALLARMNYIDRWGLMRNTRTETLSEHSLMTAVIAHILSCTANELYSADVNEGRVAIAALYHDASEIITGDLPTPVKYENDMINAEYKKVEHRAVERLCSLLPNELRSRVMPSLTGEELTKRERAIIKAADKLAALIKCIEEAQNGNREFRTAEAQTRKVIEANELPETKYFCDTFLSSYTKTLDELLGEENL